MQSITTTLTLLLLPMSGLAQDVPLVEWRNPDWPTGLPLRKNAGVSWGDFNADGWVDFALARNGKVWINHEGRTWLRGQRILPKSGRYGCVIGDYNADGLPDIATEPRDLGAGFEDLRVLENMGNVRFENRAKTHLDVLPEGFTETGAWMDVDFDGDLDYFLPAYPPIGNFFLHNIEFGSRFLERSAEAGLDNPVPSPQPEGTHFADVDRDGDQDLYCNGTLYVNVSTHDRPRFTALRPETSGITFANFVDEGCAFTDYDMDGDQDLIVTYVVVLAEPRFVRLFEARGDGTFFLAEEDRIENHIEGSGVGLSLADWDNDGDVDLTVNHFFRENQRIDTGEGRFLMATHNFPALHIALALPGWADWDRDGDLDAVISPWAKVAHLYDNVIYDESTPANERRYLRVRAVRDKPGLKRGLETEFGATAELTLAQDEPGLRRVGVVSSSGGMLNQNEYDLHFGLPADPFPEDSERDLVFDVHVDFHSDPSLGILRVDRHVNPVLGGLDLADLATREILVFRSGRVIVDGTTHLPDPGQGLRLTTTTGGLALVHNDTYLGDPQASPASDWYVGLAFETEAGGSPLRVKEVLLDGLPAADALSCAGEEAQLVLWDTTGVPVQVASRGMPHLPRNHRHSIPFEALLQPGREYRLVARVDALRPTTVEAPVVHGPLTVLGGLSFRDAAPCDGVVAASAQVDEGQVFLALRFTDA